MIRFLLALFLLVGCKSQHSIVFENEIFTEERIIISEDAQVRGILTQPKSIKNDVVMLLLSGSGCNDADYTIDNYPLYRQMAHELAQAGIASFRMNKRFIPMSELNTIQEEFIDDVTVALEMLNQKYSQVFLFGHSLSAIILPAISQDVDGLIVASGSVSELEEIYAKQLCQQANIEEKQQIQEELNTILELKEDTGFSWFGIKESYWLSLDQLNLSQKLHMISQPILVIHGSQDKMIDVSEIEKYKQALSSNEKAQWIVYDGLDHYLRKENARELEETVIQTIVSWILKESSVIMKV